MGAEENDPWKAVILMSGLPEGGERDLALGTAIQAVAEASPEEAIDFILNQENEHLKYRLAEDMVDYMAVEYPQECFQLIAQLPYNEHVELMMSSLASGWARSEFDAALEWVLDIDEPSARHEAILAISGAWLKSDPGSVKSFALQIEDEEDRLELCRRLVRLIAEDDPNSAFDWIRSMPLQRTRDALFPEAVDKWAFVAPRQAAAFVEQMEKGTGRDDSAMKLVDRWVETSAENAMKWAQDYQPATVADELKSSILAYWIGFDKTKAMQWLNLQDPGNALDELIFKTIKQLQFQPSKSGIDLIMRMRDPKTKSATLIFFFNAWKMHDSKAAMKWIESSDLPEELKQMLLKNPPDQDATPPRSNAADVQI